MLDYNNILEKVYKETLAVENHGDLATYIPELANVSPDQLGAVVISLEGQQYAVGDCDVGFSLQSVAKTFSLTMAYQLIGPELWKRVGVEPSGTSFNSLIQLERDKGVPRNPMLNAGAIVVCDILLDHLKDPKEELLDFVRELCQDNTVNYNLKVAQSEHSAGYWNKALINLMKAFGNIKNDIDLVLDFYFHLCSIEMTCRQLSRAALYLANDGKDPMTSEEILTLSRSKRMNAVLQTCGFYDEAGEFSFRVGLPGKSGVGGGIVAVHPEHFSIAVWSPRLNEKGNSYRGLHFLELFTTETGLSVF